MSVFETDGKGYLQAGSVTVLATGTISGVIVFAGPDLGLAGIGSSARLQSGFSAPVVSNSDAGIRTGLAVMNLEGDAVDCDVFQGTVVVECSGNTAVTEIQVRPGQYATLPVFPR